MACEQALVFGRVKRVSRERSRVLVRLALLPHKSGVLIKRVSVKRSLTVFVSSTVTASCPPYRMLATRGSSHSHILSYSSPTVMYRCLAINAIAASHGFSTRLSRKRISCGAKPSFSASCFHSCPPTKRNNTIFFKGI